MITLSSWSDVVAVVLAVVAALFFNHKDYEHARFYMLTAIFVAVL